MTRKFNLLLAATAGLVVFFLIGVFATRPVALTGLDPVSPVGLTAGRVAPDFTGETLSGQSVRLADLRGQVVVVNVFASWCGPCHLEAPHLVAASLQNRDDLQIIGLNLQETPAAVADFKALYTIPFPLVLDPEGALTEIYRPVGLPTTWFIDPQGIIRYMHAGPLTPELLSQAIDAARNSRNYDPFGS